MYRKNAILVALLVVMAASANSYARLDVIPMEDHPTTDVYHRWRLAMQAYTFKEFTFYEAVDKTASLGLNWIEAYPGQKLSKERPDVRFHHNMPAEFRNEVKQKLRDTRVKLVNYGVVGLPNDQTECRKVFDFAKDMGIQIIVSEPPPEALDLIEGLCSQYEIKVAIHNHPKDSRYWHPDKVLEVCEGRSKWIGACADTGHWMRSGVEPLEALMKLEGRIISLHFKDLNEFGEREAHDVVWGTGKANIKALLEELYARRFQGVFSIEYEYHWDNSVPEIRQCIEYFNSLAGQLSPTGWRDLLADDLSNCIFKPGSWAVENTILTRKGTEKSRGDIWTKEKYGDFILDLEFKLAEKTNSGIFFRTTDINDCVQTGIEVQVFDSYPNTKVGNHDCGAIYDCLAPKKNMVKKPGEWNRCTITCLGSIIYVILNGQQIIDMDLRRWTEPHKNPDGTKNKYNSPFKDRRHAGHIGFQDHGHPVWYRNIKIKRLDDDIKG